VLAAAGPVAEALAAPTVKRGGTFIEGYDRDFAKMDTVLTTWDDPTMVALYERDARGGEGQVVDLAIYESLFSLIGQQVILYDRLGVIPQRTGNAFPFVAPRNVYRASDGRYVAMAASTPSISVEAPCSSAISS